MNPDEERAKLAIAQQHKSAALIARSNRVLLRASMVALSLLLVVALTVIIWGAIRFGNEVSLIKSRQLQFHMDTQANTVALGKEAAANSCLVNTLEDVFAQSATIQADIKAHKTPPLFVYPKPC